MLQHALHYAQLGWHVVTVFGVREGRCTCRRGSSCGYPGKHPRLGLGWQNKATTDEQTIRRWLAKAPTANVGIVVGPSGLVVLDFDPRNGGAPTYERLRDVLGRALSSAPAVVTGRGDGGAHAYYRMPAGVTGGEVRELLAPFLGKGSGLDLLVDGKFVVAPPSVHSAGGRYEWRDGLPEVIPEFPIEQLVKFRYFPSFSSDTIRAVVPDTITIDGVVPDTIISREEQQSTKEQYFRPKILQKFALEDKYDRLRREYEEDTNVLRSYSMLATGDVLGPLPDSFDPKKLRAGTREWAATPGERSDVENSQAIWRALVSQARDVVRVFGPGERGQSEWVRLLSRKSELSPAYDLASSSGDVRNPITRELSNPYDPFRAWKFACASPHDYRPVDLDALRASGLWDDAEFAGPAGAYAAIMLLARHRGIPPHDAGFGMHRIGRVLGIPATRTRNRTMLYIERANAMGLVRRTVLGKPYDRHTPKAKRVCNHYDLATRANFDARFADLKAKAAALDREMGARALPRFDGDEDLDVPA